jgi:hypothetical protein
VWQWFRLAKHVKYSKQNTSHAEYQRAYCDKRLSDGVDPKKASVIYRDSTQGNTSMSTHISKHHTGEDPPMMKKQKRNAESFSSASESSAVKAAKPCNHLCL